MGCKALRGVWFVCLACVLAATQVTLAEEAVEPVQPGEKDSCPVCGMYVSLYPAWLAQVVLEDGTVLFFDGSKDLFRYLTARDRFAPEKIDVELAATLVTSYYDVKSIAASEAWFVLGSDVLGPMGAEFVPLRTRTEAQEFVSDHGGRLVRFQDVTAELLRSLR